MRIAGYAVAGFDRQPVQALLEGWARWRLSGHGADVGYPSRAAFARLIKSSWGARCPLTPDIVCVSVDRAVSQLRHKGDLRWDVLTSSYLERRTDIQISRRLNMGRGAVAKIRESAESYVDGHLDNL